MSLRAFFLSGMEAGVEELALRDPEFKKMAASEQHDALEKVAFMLGRQVVLDTLDTATEEAQKLAGESG